MNQFSLSSVLCGVGELAALARATTFGSPLAQSTRLSILGKIVTCFEFSLLTNHAYSNLRSLISLLSSFNNDYQGA
jgi:hypothetical protein